MAVTAQSGVRNDISLVIPAYNEALRLNATLLQIMEYLNSRSDIARYEVIVVDDGSQDATRRVAEQVCTLWPELRVISYPRNRGKGFAVRTGVLTAMGEYILFADADGATPIGEERRLREALNMGAEIAIGSRAVTGEGICRKRSPVRQLTGALFAACSHYVLPVGVRDTQCGFKMFRRSVARRLFSVCTEDRFLFDLFILRMARLWGYSVAEVPVNWMEMPGSKVRLVADSVSMFRRLWEVRKQTARAFAEQSLAGSPTRQRTAEASLPSPHMVAEIAEGFDASGASRG